MMPWGGITLAGALLGVAAEPPRLVRGSVTAAPWGAHSAGIAAYEVVLDEDGAVRSAEPVQDLEPYGPRLRADLLSSWAFDPAREQGRPVGARVLVLGVFLPASLQVRRPERPRYRETSAPAALPWPTEMVVPPYPPTAIGAGTVIVEVDVSEQGAVASARTMPPAGAFDGAARDAIRAWTFRPAAPQGRPLASRVFVVVSFAGITP
jgi:TonB family protein